MKHTIIVLLLLLCTSCYTVTRNCNDYKTGTFRFDYTINGVKKSGVFVRTEHYSIDYFDHKIDSSSVRWINDCEFILKKLNPKKASEQDAIHMKILTTTDTSYTFEYKLAVKKLNSALHVEKGVAYLIDDK